MDSGEILVFNSVQWNCQSLRPKSVALEALLSQENIQIAVLSETWLEPDSYCNISNYNTFRLDHYDAYGGVGILTHKSIKSTESLTRSPNVGIEMLQVRMHNCRYIENFISVYCPSTVRTSQKL